MTDELFAYLMDDLSPERRAAVEQRLATDPAWQRELKRLRECLAENADAGKCLEEPPQDLVERTCFLVQRVEDDPCCRESEHSYRTAAFTSASPCLGRGFGRWSAADLTIGGGVLLMVAALMTPALFESREAARRSMCQNNLQTFGAALFNYQEGRGHQLPPVEPGESAGMYAVKLVESGVLTREQLRQLLVCPESRLADDVFAGRIAIDLPSRRQLQLARDEQRARMIMLLGGSYAYRLGFYDENGRYQDPPFTGEQGSPLMGDAPHFTTAGARSANHGGNGFNFVDQSLAVRFRRNCLLGGDNLFTNVKGEQAAGLEPNDVVLGRSEIGRDGPVIEIRIERQPRADLPAPSPLGGRLERGVEAGTHAGTPSR
jgi:hypothetical protein